MGEDNTKDIKPENSGKIRNEKGQFIEGVSGNPAGKPKGAGISVVTEIKRKLEEVPEGSKSTYLKLFLNRYFKKAIQEGDVQILKDLINRVDGMPKQSNEITGESGNPIEVVVTRINENSNKPSTKTR